MVSLLLQSVCGGSIMNHFEEIYLLCRYILYVFKLKFGKGSVVMWIFQRVCGGLGWRFEI